jgi:anti-anti-sigma factor
MTVSAFTSIDAEVTAPRLTAGRLDTRLIPAFRVALLDLVDRAQCSAVVDLSQTPSLDAAGAAALVGAARRFAARGGRLVLTQPSEQVLATLTRHGLNRYLPVVAPS